MNQLMPGESWDFGGSLQTKGALVTRQIERPLALKARNYSLLAGLVAGALALFGCSGGTGRSVAASSLVSGATQTTSDPGPGSNPGPGPTQVSPTQGQPASTPASTVTSVAISPSPVSALPGGHLQFTALVQGSAADKSVTWRATLGGISASGFYTAPMIPSTDTVTAISNADQTESGTANVTVTSPSPTPSGPLPAFAGAQGAGAVSVGGRGGSVILVTNLNDSGTGSLRACIQANGPRTCIFRVAGTIITTSPLTISNPNITIAGQSAPGGGITVNGKNAPYGIIISTHDVIMRYIRSRMGWTSAEATQEGSPIWIGNGNCYNIIMDHVDVSWTRDENLTIWRFAGQPPIHSITFSWGLNSEPLAGHPTSFGIGATDSATVAGITDIDVHHTLMVDASHRIPLIGIPNIRWVNNITYNWAFYAVQMLGGVTGDFIGNYWKPGALNNLNTHEIQSGPGGAQEMPGNPSIYLAGNLGYHVANPTADNWPLAAQVSGQNGSETGALTRNDQRSTPQAALPFPITADSVSNLEALLVPNTATHPAGASQRLDCNGNWVMNRDAVDLRLISTYNAGAGTLPNSEQDVGGYPAIDPGVPCTESLNDGIPDQWKIANGLSTTDTGLYARVAPNGFTYLENYLNGN